MAQCIACGNKSLFTEEVAGLRFCKSCLRAIRYSEWKDMLFLTANDLEIQYQKAMNDATAHGFSNEGRGAIVRLFKEERDKGFKGSIRGGQDQTIKVYEDMIVIYTSSSFDFDEMGQLYSRIVELARPKDPNRISISQKNEFIQGVMRKGLVKASMQMATAKLIDATATELDHYMTDLSGVVSKGTSSISFLELKAVEELHADKYPIGLLRFITAGDTERVFFYENESTIRSQILVLKDIIVKQIKRNIPQSNNWLSNDSPRADLSSVRPLSQRDNNFTGQRFVEPLSTQPVQAKTEDVFEQVRKFKTLLDDGIITPEEFEKKKKELLNL